MASLAGVTAVAIATLSASHFHRAYSPPLEVYDNERAVLGVIYFALALGISLVSLTVAWSRRSEGSLVARIISASSAVWLSAVLLYAWLAR